MIEKIDESSIHVDDRRSSVGPIIALALATLMASLAISSTSIILPELESVFDTTFILVQWVMISYILFLTSTLVIAGRFSDLYGHKRVFLVGVVIFTVCAGVSGFTQSLWQLVLSRAMQGVGGAIIVTVSMVIASDIFPKNKIASAMGLIASMSAVGTGLGPVLAGLIVDVFYWQLVFLINLPLGLTTYVLAKRYLPNDVKKKDSTSIDIDFKSIFLLFFVILTYTLGLKVSGEAFEGIRSIIILSFLVSIVMFIYFERKSTYPLIKLKISKNSELIISLISNFIVSTVVMTSLVVGPFYLVIALE